MICPRCNKHSLEEQQKGGIIIDICHECRGIWLDHGELERLIAKATQEMGGHADSYNHRNDYHDGHGLHKQHSQGSHHEHENIHHQKKRHWLAELFD